jgi:hypothetical protein
MHPNLPKIIHEALLSDRREPTGLLHCSSDSWKPLRFIQLESVLGKTDEDEYGSLMTMKLGTLTHDWLESYLKLADLGDWELVASEWDVTPYLPEGWTGTLDHLFRHKPTNTLSIMDVKTAKPESIQYLGNKPKTEHTTQVSCYHTAVERWLVESAGNRSTSLDPEIAVCYVPKGKTSKQETIEPVIKTAYAEPSAWANMVGISRQVAEYKAKYERTGELLNDCLASMPEPELKVFWDKTQNNWTVKSLPSWMETYMCGFDEALCPRTPSAKVGSWSIDGYWQPRKGYAVDKELVPRPSDDEIRRRRG